METQRHTLQVGPHTIDLHLIFTNKRSALHSPTQKEIVQHFFKKLFVWTELRPYTQKILERYYYISPFITDSEDYVNKIKGAWAVKYLLYIADHDLKETAVQTDEECGIELNEDLHGTPPIKMQQCNPSDSSPPNHSCNSSSQLTTEDSFSGFDSQAYRQMEADMLSERINFNGRAAGSHRSLGLQLQGVRKISNNEIRMWDTVSQVDNNNCDTIGCFDKIFSYFGDIDIAHEWTNGESDSPTTYEAQPERATQHSTHSLFEEDGQYVPEVAKGAQDVTITDDPEPQDSADMADSQDTVCDLELLSSIQQVVQHGAVPAATAAQSPLYYDAQSQSSKSEEFKTPPQSAEFAPFSQDTALEYEQLNQSLDLPTKTENDPCINQHTPDNSSNRNADNVSSELLVSPQSSTGHNSPSKVNVNSPKIVPLKRRPLRNNNNLNSLSKAFKHI